MPHAEAERAVETGRVGTKRAKGRMAAMLRSGEVGTRQSAAALAPTTSNKDSKS